MKPKKGTRNILDLARTSAINTALLAFIRLFAISKIGAVVERESFYSMTWPFLAILIFVDVFLLFLYSSTITPKEKISIFKISIEPHFLVAFTNVILTLSFLLLLTYTAL